MSKITPDKSLAAEIEAILRDQIVLRWMGPDTFVEGHEEAACKIAAEIAANQSRAFEDGARWKTTGRATVAFGGGGTREWFRQSDGCLKDYPTGFDPNTGAYSSMVAQWIDRPLQPEGERSDA